MLLLPISPRLERRGIGQGALIEVRSGTGRAQRPLPDNEEKMRQKEQSAKALDGQPRKAVCKNSPPRLPGQEPDLARIIPGPRPLECV
jgi:hypothetical protein